MKTNWYIIIGIILFSLAILINTILCEYLNVNHFPRRYPIPYYYYLLPSILIFLGIVNNKK